MLVGIATVTARTIQYNHTVLRGDITIGVGTVTAACVQLGPDHILKAVEIPPTFSRVSAHSSKDSGLVRRPC